MPFKTDVSCLLKKDGAAQFARLAFAFLLMSLVAVMYSQEKINTEDFALGKESVHSAEAVQGMAYTASSVQEIKAVIDRGSAGCSGGRVKKVMWLGNSQLHTINQFKAGQHLAPYWVREKSKRPDCFLPYGFSLPNANFQEYLALATYVSSATRIDAAVLSIVFDDLREDGLRADFSALMSDSMRAALAASEAGSDILAHYEKELARTKGGAEENHGLEGFVQKRFEDLLTDVLGQVIPLWAERANFRASLMIDLYFLRNYILHIKPTTVRKQIPARYIRNMAALEAALRGLHGLGIPIILYIAPIRQGISLPYDLAEYTQWKKSMAELASKYNAQLLNLEAEVPARLWGSYHEDDVDFMHFQGEGHSLLAQAIAPALHAAIGEF